MKRIIIILLMLLVAADLLSAEASFDKSDSTTIPGPDGTALFTPGTDTKKVQEKLADALVKLDSWKNARTKEKIEPLNSTQNNISSNCSMNNSSLLNSSAPTVTDVADANEDGQNVGSSSRGRFSGYYGMTASRHEIGKSGIDSHMFLSGTFEMDKTVKFQDRGV